MALSGELETGHHPCPGSDEVAAIVPPGERASRIDVTEIADCRCITQSRFGNPGYDVPCRGLSPVVEPVDAVPARATPELTNPNQTRSTGALIEIARVMVTRARGPPFRYASPGISRARSCAVDPHRVPQRTSTSPSRAGATNSTTHVIMKARTTTTASRCSIRPAERERQSEAYL